MKKDTRHIINQAKIWIVAASVLPLVALAGLYFSTFIGWITNLEKVLTIGATIMFAISVLWWWWAVYKIIEFANLLKNTDESLQEIKSNIKSIKKDIL